MIEQATLQKVKQTADIIEVISDFVKLRRRGQNYFGLCPFHMEKTPSFSVSPSRQKYKCFGCGRTGDVFDFLQEHQGLSLPESIGAMADRYGIAINHYRDPHEELYQTMEAWSTEFRERLLEQAEAMEYLLGRGITEAEIQSFEIGYCPYLKPSEAVLVGYDSPELLDQCGMLSQSGNLLFSGRITFAIRNEAGNLVGFSARTIQASARTAKYINSRASGPYQKDRLLYGFKMARSMGRIRDELNLVEGFTDVMAMHRVGRSNTVATCGTAFTEGHAKLIKRLCSRVNFYFDGDAAGKKASKAALQTAMGEGLQVSVKRLPEGEDVYSMVQAGRSMELPDISIGELFVNGHRRDNFDTAQGIEESIAVIAGIPNPITRDLEINQLCRTFAVSPRLIHQRVREAVKQQHNKNGTNLSRTANMAGGHRSTGRGF
jgi:DNA primase